MLAGAIPPMKSIAFAILAALCCCGCRRQQQPPNVQTTSLNWWNDATDMQLLIVQVGIPTIMTNVASLNDAANVLGTHGFRLVTVSANGSTFYMTRNYFGTDIVSVALVPTDSELTNGLSNSP